MKIIDFPLQYHYHNIPGYLDRISVQPQREYIEQALRRIPHNKFPELVADLLRAAGHRDVRIVDGAGDEGRDIHSIRPDGTLQLTQCKHHESPKGRVDVDELDLAVISGGRKGYTQILLVTNTGLTAPAKKYVLDQQYAKINVGGTQLSVTIWASEELWSQLHESIALLEKWFSGLAQIHAVSSFRVLLLPLQMPEEKPLLQVKDMEQFMGEVLSLPGAAKLSDEAVALELDGYTAKLGVDIGSMSDFRDPTAEDLGTGNIPYLALELQVVAKKEPFQVNTALGAIVKTLTPALRKKAQLGQQEWISLLCSYPTTAAFVYSTDSVTQLVLAEREAFIITKSVASTEPEFVLSCGAEWARSQDDEDDSYTFWLGKDRVKCLLFMESPTGAMEFEYGREALARLNGDFDSFDFFIVEQVDHSTVDEIRASVPRDSMVAEHSDNLLIGLYGDDKVAHLAEMKAKFALLGINYRAMTPDELEKLRADLAKQAAQPVESAATFSLLGKWTSPARLLKRVLWIEAKISPPALEEKELEARLMSFKFSFLEANGGKVPEPQRMADFVARRFLYDPLTIRGDRDVHLRLNDDEVEVLYAYRVPSTLENKELLDIAAAEFGTLLRTLKQHIEGTLKGAWSAQVVPREPTKATKK